MAGGPTALTLIARTSATGAQPLSLRARFPRPRPPMKKIPLAAADPDRLDTWVKYREGLCGECNATCCTLPVEVRIDDLIRMRLVDEFEREEPAKRIAKRLEKDGVIEHFNHKREIFTLTRMANGDCLYLDRKTRLCTIYARRPDTCRNHPRIGPRPGHCAYRPKQPQPGGATPWHSWYCPTGGRQRKRWRTSSGKAPNERERIASRASRRNQPASSLSSARCARPPL